MPITTNVGIVAKTVQGDVNIESIEKDASIGKTFFQTCVVGLHSRSEIGNAFAFFGFGGEEEVVGFGEFESAGGRKGNVGDSVGEPSWFETSELLEDRLAVNPANVGQNQVEERQEVGIKQGDVLSEEIFQVRLEEIVKIRDGQHETRLAFFTNFVNRFLTTTDTTIMPEREKNSSRSGSMTKNGQIWIIERTLVWERCLSFWMNSIAHVALAGCKSDNDDVAETCFAAS